MLAFAKCLEFAKSLFFKSSLILLHFFNQSNLCITCLQRSSRGALDWLLCSKDVKVRREQDPSVGGRGSGEQNPTSKLGSQ